MSPNKGWKMQRTMTKYVYVCFLFVSVASWFLGQDTIKEKNYVK